MGSSPAWEGRAKRGAREHNHSQQIVHIAKTESGTDDEFDFVVGSFRVSVGEPEVCGGSNGREVTLDFLAQIPEDRDSTALSPSHPFSESASDLVRAGFEGQTEIFLEQIGSVKFGIGFGQELQLSLLVFRQMFRIFEQSIADILHPVRLLFLGASVVCVGSPG